jgi:acetyl esterase/lipase
LDSARLEAVHEQRIEWNKRRGILPSLGVYQDFRAVMTNEKAPRSALARDAHEAEAQIVFSSAPPGVENRILFLDRPELDGFELPHHAWPDDPQKWQRAARKQKQFAEEAFGAATGPQATDLAKWDQSTRAKPVALYASVDFPEEGADARLIAFRNTSTHVLATDLRPDDIVKSLRAGHAYVAHDWLCDPTGVRFFAENNLGVYEMGDDVQTGLLAGATEIRAAVSTPAHLKLIRNGQLVAEANDAKLEYTVQEGGVYRLEAWLNADGEERPWIFTNPLYVRKNFDLRLPPAQTPQGVDFHPDIPYVEGSTDNKQKLDLYIPRDKKNMPVILFLHGGTWTTGDRSLYRALGNRLAREGIAVAIPSYRLMGTNIHPAQMEDTASAFAWVYRNIEQFGGDPKRIYAVGHSSGGHQVSLLALDDRYLKKFDLSPADIRGVVSMSGVYDIDNITYFKTDGVRQDASPQFHVHRGTPKFLLSYCQWDYLGLPKQARDFAAALKKSFNDARLIYIPNDNHYSEIVRVAEDGPLLRAILSFVE